MIVTYINHSSFLIESESCYLIFDYFEGQLPALNYQKPIYIFSSHKHGDHYSAEIFKIFNLFVEQHFILSSDIKHLVPKEYKERVLYVEAHQSYIEGCLKIETLKSTDKGVAFLISVEDKLIYHAGDLNCWVWDEATKAENNNMKKRYIDEMEKLQDKDIFIAFIPLDPRQEQYFDLGMKYFFENAKSEYVIPMHMWGDYSIIKKLKSISVYEEYKEKILEINEPMDSFKFYN